MKAKQKQTTQTAAAIQMDALRRATTNVSMANYGPIFEGFIAKGIPMDDIKPRENVFTFHAWKAQGRVVKRGEHGVKVVTYVETHKVNGAGEVFKSKYPKTTVVFHISQTKPIDEEGSENENVG